MSVDYKHCLAVADLSWMPKDEADFQSLEERLNKVLTDYKLVEACVEKRTGQSRQIRLSADCEIGEWRVERGKTRGLPSSTYELE